MRTARRSGRLGGGVCRGWVSARGVGVCPGSGVCRGRGCTLPLPLWTDRRLWKHNVSATTVADGNEKAQVKASHLYRIRPRFRNNYSRRVSRASGWKKSLFCCKYSVHMSLSRVNPGDSKLYIILLSVYGSAISPSRFPVPPSHPFHPVSEILLLRRLGNNE